jgi:signal transduction histidine kinase
VTFTRSHRMAATATAETILRPGLAVARRGWAAGWLPPAGRQLLGVPLALKLAGANAVVLMTAIGLAIGHEGLSRSDFLLLGAALVLSFVISTVLVILALEPVRALERTARRILAGELDARVEVSVLADRDVRRVAHVLNNLLEAITSERERIRDLAVRVVSAHDDERARVARELEDSTAQGLAALLYEIRGELDRTADEATRARLERLLGMAGSNLEELRSITSVVHPRVLTDLGLAPALQWLARGVRKRHDIHVAVNSSPPAPQLRPVISAALFAVAREAVGRAVETGGTARISMWLEVDGHEAQLRVDCDGQRLTPGQVDDLERALRERVGLVDGQVTIEQRDADGMAVTALIPMNTT